jgi:predicted NAD/FAD-binding protein
LADPTLTRVPSANDSAPAAARPRVAIVGSGISGLSAAWALQSQFDITVFEAAGRIGGHTNTVIFDAPEGPVPVDTGFIVYNQPNYPNLTALLSLLGVASNTTRMNFSVSAKHRNVEYASHGFAGLFADLRNLVRPRFYAMLADIMRFYKQAPQLAEAEDDQSIGEFLRENGYGDAFVKDHLLPMAAAIWSCPVGTILEFPARSLAKFFVNHGLVELGTPFDWASIDGGSASYIPPLIESFKDRIKTDTRVIRAVRRDGKIHLTMAGGDTDVFDHVILACHAPQSAKILQDQDAQERTILSAFQTQSNRAILHTDSRLMPKRKRAWAAWNYISEAADNPALAVTYWMNRLQRLNTRTDCFVTLNPVTPPAADKVIAEFEYQHPVFDAAATQAQADIWDIQGRGNIWYAGAWLGYGFHEDGLQAGLAVAEEMSNWQRPWPFDRSQERLMRPELPAPKPAVAA